MPEIAPAPPYGRTMPDRTGPGWRASLQEACELLWPPPAVITVETGRGHRSWRLRQQAQPGDSEFALIPGIQRPPILVPADRRTVAAAVRYYSTARSRPVRLAARMLSIGVAGGLGGAVLRGRVRVRAPEGADTIDRYLGSVMARDIRVSMRLGRPRANRKPVLQMLDGSDRPAGFAKVGINPLTRSLVEAEHESLELLAAAGLTEIQIPRVLHYGIWHGLNVLVLDPLPAWLRRRPVAPGRLVAAMTELARVGGLQCQPLAGSDYVRRLRSRIAEADPSPERDALRQALDALGAQAGDVVFTFGSWHGDWAPWNMANTGGGLLVWDWERFTSGVPLGFDALHYWLQVALGKTEPRAAATGCLQHAAEQLTPFGIPAAQARLTAVLYLIDLATRYTVDRQAEAGARLGATGTWLIPAIAGEVARLAASPPP